MSQPAPPAAYRVLARTYRPTRLSELIGQDALVRTLTNALASGRIAHAFLLTGIRGIGKTTTARIIARALNCVGPDGRGGPTPEPCGVCVHCEGIAKDRHIDVIEMDAATRTGIDDIREIVDSVRYGPSHARYKVYIVDEVHMLSEKAFNGLLKTLEEPPPHAIFVFATTEVRKVPVTVLSRCQRFDLRRVETPVLVAHLESICAKETIGAAPEALALIARAAEGSVRDSLSLLDQAIALGDGEVRAGPVRDMLGLADRARLVELFDRVMCGDAGAVLDRMAELHAFGADPEAVLHDLLDFSHALSRAKVVPESGAVFGLAPEESARAADMAAKLGMGVLARAWQMLLRGIEDVRLAANPQAAAEMVLLRLACASDLPPPAELARLLRDGADASAPPAAAAASTERRPAPTPSALAPTPEPAPTPSAPAPSMPAPEPVLQTASSVSPVPTSFAEATVLLERHRQPALAAWLRRGAHLVRYEPGQIELRLDDSVPRDVLQRARETLEQATGMRWLMVISESEGEATLAEQDAATQRARVDEVAEDPTVRTVLDSFPGATIVEVRPRRREA